jgi:hypothetical protein
VQELLGLRVLVAIAARRLGQALARPEARGQALGRLHALGERPAPEAAHQLGEAAHLARHAHRQAAARGQLAGGLAVAEEQLGADGRGRGLAEVEGDGLLLLRQVHDREAPAPDPRGLGVHHPQRQCGGARGVRGVASGPEQLDPGRGGGGVVGGHGSVGRAQGRGACCECGPGPQEQRDNPNKPAPVRC